MGLHRTKRPHCCSAVVWEDPSLPFELHATAEHLVLYQLCTLAHEHSCGTVWHYEMLDHLDLQSAGALRSLLDEIPHCVWGFIGAVHSGMRACPAVSGEPIGRLIMLR